MKKFILALVVGFSPLCVANACAHHGHEGEHEHAEHTGYTEIHAEALKAWYDEGHEMIVLDARSEPYYDGTLLPNAIWLPYDASDKDLQAAAPEKTSLIVVYCSSIECPASAFLVKRLVAEGYTNLYKYPEGLEDWIQKGYPVVKQ